MSNHNFFLTEPEETGPQRRGILLLFKKNLGLKVTKVEQLNYNLVKLVIEHTVVNMSIYGCYGHSDGDRYEYFLNVRKHTLEDENDDILIIGDLHDNPLPGEG